MSVGIIIQARMGSSRLPGKVLRLIDGKPLLERILGRLGRLRHAAMVVVATSTKPLDGVIADWCAARGVTCFRGDEADVLDRYWQCACLYDFAHIVRLTADNPFTDIEELDRLLEMHLAQGYDYSHSFGQMPLGVGAEVFTRQALGKSHAQGHKPNHREHVNEYIEEQPELFRIGRLEVPAAKLAPTLRLTVDTEEDWRRADGLAASAHGREVGTEEAIRLCSPSA